MNPTKDICRFAMVTDTLLVTALIAATATVLALRVV